MQLLFSFDQDMSVNETLMQTLACQLSCKSCSGLTRTCELTKLKGWWKLVRNGSESWLRSQLDQCNTTRVYYLRTTKTVNEWLTCEVVMMCVWCLSTYKGSMCSLDDFDGGSYAEWESKPPIKSTEKIDKICHLCIDSDYFTTELWSENWY